MERKISFKEWLTKFKGVDRPIGDLANDVLSDLKFPDIDNQKEIISYLQHEKNADLIVIKVFKDVWKAYKTLI